MGELNTSLIRPSSDNRFIVLASLLKKVELKFSASQVQALVLLMQHYFHHQPVISMEEKSTMMLLFSIYEKKIRPKQVLRKPKLKLSLDMAQANALFQMFIDLNLNGFPFEQSLCAYITTEIHQQTC